MSVHWGGRGPGHLSRWTPAAVAAPTYTAEATALFARMTSQPDATRKGLIDACITSLKSAGVWAKLECLWLTAAADSQQAKLNWVSSSFALSAVNSPTFTADRGYAGDGSSSYLNTNYTPSSGALYAQNSASFGAWLNAGTDTATSSVVAMGAATGGGQILLTPRDGTGNIRARLNSSTSAEFQTVPTRLGFSGVSRTASTSTKAYRNNAASSVDGTTSAGNPTVAVFLGGWNSAGALASPCDNRFAALFVGTSLSDTEMGNLYSALNIFLTAIGAN